jgi:transcriptional repressor NrdR
MKCPFCGDRKDRVVDSRESREGAAIRRRRECSACSRRFTSYETVEEVPLMVVKRDGRREPWDRRKLLGGLRRACEKRPIPSQELEDLVADLENRLQESEDREVEAKEIGALVMARLRELDQVAYVRFASVYRRFEDIDAFVTELKGLLGSTGTPEKS